MKRPHGQVMISYKVDVEFKNVGEAWNASSIFIQEIHEIFLINEF